MKIWEFYYKTPLGRIVAEVLFTNADTHVLWREESV
jgi:hypothetical protein